MLQFWHAANYWNSKSHCSGRWQKTEGNIIDCYYNEGGDVVLIRKVRYSVSGAIANYSGGQLVCEWFLITRISSNYSNKEKLILLINKIKYILSLNYRDNYTPWGIKKKIIYFNIETK